MAEVLDSFDFIGRGRRQKYPWSDWLNGKIWKLTQGHDFSVSPGHMRNSVFTAARANGKRVHTRVDGDCLYIQTYMDDEESEGE